MSKEEVKNTLRELIEKYNFKKFVTNTTRSPRVGEVNHIDYHFITIDEFKEKERNNKLIESTFYNGNYYGTSLEDVSSDKVLIVDIPGANKFYEKIKDEAVYFFISCNKEDIKKRMIERGDSLESIKKRLDTDDIYFNIKLLKHYDYIINTDNISIEDVTKDVYKKYLNKQGE